MGEKVRGSVWHMKTKPVHYYTEEVYRREGERKCVAHEDKSGPLLHGGGI